jgi:hypothetical protein
LSVAIHRCDGKKWAVVIGYRYYGETCGVHALIVSCAFANLLAMEYEQYYIQKYLDISRKKTTLYSILHRRNKPTFFSNTPPKMGYLRCDSRGIYALVPIHGEGTCEKKSILMK